MRQSIKLVKDKKDCCGCMVCANICPKNAITMVLDEYGFSYPQINKDLCCSCGLCIQTCNYKKSKLGEKTINSFAAVTTNDNIHSKSSSGGIFATIARSFIKDRGVVYGCSLEENSLNPIHIRVDRIENIRYLQGSKYVQSYMGEVFVKVKKDLEGGKKVLFSGTPCQVEAMKSFLGEKYNEIYYIDFICHGVPSTKLFKDYLRYLEERLGGEITDFIFRDKKRKDVYVGTVTYKKNGVEKKKAIPSNLSSYYNYFLKSKICRESCYYCEYAKENRVSDLTLGDYWGLKNEHPEFFDDKDFRRKSKKGISCIIVNSEHGHHLINDYGNELLLKETKIDKIAKNNHQLVRPSSIPIDRQVILELYVQDGYQGVENNFNKELGKKKYLYIIWNHFPYFLRVLLRRNCKKLSKRTK